MKQQPFHFRWLAVGYGLLCLLFVVYSYTQVDLNLTLSTNQQYQKIQGYLLHLGYYQRSFSTLILVVLLIGFFSFYAYFLQNLINRTFQPKHIFALLGVSSILLFAYPAFSHDIFNYMFDARIVSTYHLDPLHFRALDFPADTWTRFMRWTHRYYPYGPGWLWLSLIPVFIGGGRFVATLFLFKFVFLLFYFINCYLVYQLARLIDPNRALVRLSLFALNPLVLVESIVSPHNEVMMITCVLLAFYFISKKHFLYGSLSFIFSILIKFISAALLPLLVLFPRDLKVALEWSVYLWLVLLVPVIATHELYSWYFVPVIALAVLGSFSSWKFAFLGGASFALLTKYLPFLLTGEYSLWTSRLEQYFMLCTLITITFISHRLLWYKKN